MTEYFQSHELAARLRISWKSAMLTLGIVCVALIAQFALDPYLGNTLPYVSFVIAVTVVAWYSELGPTILALFAGACLSAYFFTPPRHSFAVSGIGWVAFSTYFMITIPIAILADRQKTSTASLLKAQERMMLQEGEQRRAEQLRDSEARLRLSIQSANIGLWEWDLQTNAVYFSPEWKAQIGYSDDEITNRFTEWESRVHPDDLAAANAKVGTYLTNPHGMYESEFRLRHKDGSYRWIYTRGDVERSAHGEPLRLRGCNIDNTERMEAVRSLAQVSRLYLALSKVNEAVLRTRDVNQLFTEICRIAVEDGLLRMAWVGIVDPVTQWVEPAAKWGVEDGYLDKFRISAADIPEGWGPTGLAIRHGRSIVRQDLMQDMNLAPVHDELRKRGYRSNAAFPIRVSDKVIGAVTFYSGEAFYFSEEIAGLLEKLSNNLGFAIESAQHAIESKQAETALRASEASLKEAQNIAQLGSFDFDFKSGVWKSSEVMDTLLGIGPDYDRSLAGWLALVHPNDQASLADYAKIDVLGQLSTTNMEYRIIRQSDQAVRWLWSRATLERDAEGRAIRMYGTSLDITDRKQAEGELRERENLIKGILESTTDGVAVFDKDWRYRFVNEAFVRRTGMTQDQFLGKTPWDLFPEMVETEPFQKAQHAMKKRVVEDYEFYFPRVPGWFSSRAFPISDGGLVTFSRNITEQKMAQERLRESEEKFRTLADLVPQMVWMCTPDGLNVYFNQRWVDYTGMSLEETYGRGWNTPFHDDDKPKAWEAWNHSVTTGERYSVESRLRAADGSFRWFLMQGTPLRDADGNIIKWFGTCTDIEDMKQAEATLRESEERFSNAFHTSPAAITITRIADGKFVDVNPAFLRLFEFAREEVIGHTSLELKILTADARRELIRSQLDSGGLRNEELLAYTKSGRPIQLLFSSKPMVLAGETHHVTTLIDITERKQAEERLRESEASLKESQLRAQLGSSDFDFASETWTSSEVMDKLFGIDATYRRTLAGWLALVHPEDRAKLADYGRIDVFSHTPALDIEYRIIRHNDRAERWMWTRATLERDPEGVPRGCTGPPWTLQIARRRSKLCWKARKSFVPSPTSFRRWSGCAPRMA